MCRKNNNNTKALNISVMKPNHILFWKVFTKESVCLECMWNCTQKMNNFKFKSSQTSFQFYLFYFCLSFLLLLLCFGSDGLSR